MTSSRKITPARAGRLAAVAALSILGTFAMSGAALADDGVTETYVSGPIGDTVGVVCQGDGTGPATLPVGLGGACFTVAGEATLSATAKDDTGQPVPGSWQFQDASGKSVKGSGQFCGSTTSLGVPASAAVLFVYVGAVEPNYSAIPPLPLSCPTPEPNTTGTITVSGPGVSKFPSSGNSRRHTSNGGSARPAAAGSAHRAQSRGRTSTADNTSASETYYSGVVGDAGGNVQCQGPQSTDTIVPWGQTGQDPPATVGLPVSTPYGIGGACFKVQAGTDVAIKASDQYGGDKVAGVAYFADAHYVNTGTSTFFCGSLPKVTVPAGAAIMLVSVGTTQPDIVLGVPKLPCGTPHPNLTGTITATGPGVGGVEQTSAAGVSFQLKQPRTTTRGLRAL